MFILTQVSKVKKIGWLVRYICFAVNHILKRKREYENLGDPLG